MVLTTNVSGSLKEYTYDKGAVIEAPQAPALDDGFIFKGWTTDLENIDDLYDFSKPLTSDKVLYAVIIAVQPDYDPNDNNHLIQFKYNLKTVPMSYSFVRHMDKASFPEPTEVDGYEFDAWYTDISYTELVNLDLPITKDVTYFGKYVSTEVDDVTIYLDCGLGSIGGSSLLTKTVPKGTAFQTVFNSVDPICDNYLFDGWYHDKTFTSRVVPTDTITKDLYVYANWVPTLDVFRYYGTQMYDVLDLDDINSNNVHVDDNTIYVRLATVTGEIISSGAPIPGNGGRIQIGTTSSTITASSISNCIVNSYEKIITKPKCPISSVGASVGILDKIEIGLDFGFDLGDTTTRTLNQYISQDSQFNGNGLSYNVTYHLESVNGMWYRVAHTTVYQIIQYIEVTDWSDPSNPKFSTGYMTMMEPLVIQLQCSDNPSFKDTVEKECYDLDSETIINLIGEYIVGSSRSDMNKVIFHSELGDDSVRYKYVEDGKTISDDPSEFFINDGYWVVGWSDVPTDSKVFSRESIINLDSPIYEDKDLYAIWLPDRLKEENFTLICNQEELSEINDDLGGDYVLATDITLTGAWTPIADEKEEYFFGTLDGAGHSISNLKITGKFTSNYYKDLGTDGNDFTYIGLFAKVGSKAEISYMSFVDFLISPSSDKGWISAGCVAGLSRGGLFHDIVLDSGDVISKTADTIDTATKEAFGGLIGVAQDMTVIQDCIVREGTSVKASGYYTYAGGLVGSLEHNGVTISCCINEADVTGSGSKDVGVGGITGAMKHDGSLIEFCYNLGVIRGQPNSEKCSEGPHVGHMIGYDYIEGKSGDINFCYGLIDHLYKKGKLVDNGMVGYGKVNTDSNNHREYASRFIVTTWEDNDHMPSTDLRWDGKNGFYLQWEADE